MNCPFSELTSPVDMPSTQNANKLHGEKQTASITNQIEITSSAMEENASPPPGSEELFPVFDYFSHRHKFTSQEITLMTNKPAPCKDSLAVDELLELLKKKLSSDPSVKDLLFPMKYPDPTDIGVTDVGVAAFVSRLYSKKEITTTTKAADKEYINSTLLADLVEAVIFRGGGMYFLLQF